MCGCEYVLRQLLIPVIFWLWHFTLRTNALIILVEFIALTRSVLRRQLSFADDRSGWRHQLFQFLFEVLEVEQTRPFGAGWSWRRRDAALRRRACYQRRTMHSEWVSSFLTAHQHINTTVSIVHKQNTRLQTAPRLRRWFKATFHLTNKATNSNGLNIPREVANILILHTENIEHVTCGNCHWPAALWSVATRHGLCGISTLHLLAQDQWQRIPPTLSWEHGTYTLTRNLIQDSNKMPAVRSKLFSCLIIAYIAMHAI